MICENCHVIMPVGAKFCTACGASVAYRREVIEAREVMEVLPPTSRVSSQVNLPDSDMNLETVSDMNPETVSDISPETVREQGLGLTRGPAMEATERGPAPAPVRRAPVPDESVFVESSEKSQGIYRPRIYIDRYAEPERVWLLPQSNIYGENDGGAYSPEYRTVAETGDEKSGSEQSPESEHGKTGYGKPHVAAENSKSSMTGEVMTFGQFFIMELLSMVPIVGLIIMCVWAFSRGTNPNRAALAQAKLIVLLILTFIISFAFVILLIMISNNIITVRWLAMGRVR